MNIYRIHPMNTYKIYFDGGMPAIFREAESELDAINQGYDYLVGIDSAECIRCVERLAPERGSNA